MGCCGKKGLKIPNSQRKIIEAVQNSPKKTTSIIKSNRSRPGTVAKQCPSCGAKVLYNVCQFCFYKFD
jgi:beta-lactam-binding protein with PASTA domain